MGHVQKLISNTSRQGIAFIWKWALPFRELAVWFAHGVAHVSAHNVAIHRVLAVGLGFDEAGRGR